MQRSPKYDFENPERNDDDKTLRSKRQSWHCSNACKFDSKCPEFFCISQRRSYNQRATGSSRQITDEWKSSPKSDFEHVERNEDNKTLIREAKHKVDITQQQRLHVQFKVSTVQTLSHISHRLCSYSLSMSSTIRIASSRSLSSFHPFNVF